jgi:hypothetical protein
VDFYLATSGDLNWPLTPHREHVVELFENTP